MRVLRQLQDRLALTETSVVTSSQDHVLLGVHPADTRHDRLQLAGATTVDSASSEGRLHLGTHLADLLNQRFEQVQPKTAYFEGTGQDDLLLGTAFADTMHGRGGNDTLHGFNGNDVIFGDEGDDKLYGDAGNDTLDGGDGNDTLFGGTGADALIGGAGTDTASYEHASSGVMLDLATVGITGDAAGDTYSGIENVIGSAYGDIINGDQNNNVINGGAGDDFLFGGAGDDRLSGGYGDDVLRGGAGNDTLIAQGGTDRLTGDDPGSVGRDTFVISQVFLDSNGHIITDFQHGFDKIDLTAFSEGGRFNLLGSDGQIAIGPCHLTTGVFGSGTEAENPVWTNGGLEANDHLVFDPSSSTLYYVNVAWSEQNHGYYIDFVRTLVTLEGVHELSASDLVLYEHINDLSNYGNYATFG